MKRWICTESPEVEGSRAPPPSQWLFALVGLLQGIVLYAIYLWAKSDDVTRSWPQLLAALIQFCVLLPTAWALLHDSYWSGRSRILLAIWIALVSAALAWHAIDGEKRPPEFSLPSSLVVAHAVLLYVAGTLLAGFDGRAQAFRYPRLFELAWRNAVLVPVALTLTGILWALLWAAAWLLTMIGTKALQNAIAQPITILLVTSSGAFLGMALALRRADALVSLRRFWLALNSWFLPMALLLAFAAVVAIGVLGTDKLFETGFAAASLFWFISFSIVFVNATFQDGAEPPAYPAPLLKATRWLWMAMPVLAVVGAAALGLRVREHGWTPDRIWAGVVCAMTLVYTIGYAVPVRTGKWMACLPATNVMAGGLLVLLLAPLLTPLADVRRMAVESQVRRLRGGEIDPGKFDFRALAQKGGRYGQAALQDLASSGTSPPRVRELASRYLTREQKQTDAAAKLAEVPVYPRGATLDDDLLRWARDQQLDGWMTACLSRPDRCLIWLRDMDKDGTKEMLLIYEIGTNRTSAQLYFRDGVAWRRVGALHRAEPTLLDWRSAIESEKVTDLPARWPDLVVNGQRLSLQ